MHCQAQQSAPEEKAGRRLWNQCRGPYEVDADRGLGGPERFRTDREGRYRKTPTVDANARVRALRSRPVEPRPCSGMAARRPGAISGDPLAVGTDVPLLERIGPGLYWAIVMLFGVLVAVPFVFRKRFASDSSDGS